MNFNKCKNKLMKFIFKLKEDNISEYAAEAAYFTIISFIPFVLFFITLTKFASIDKDIIFIVLNEVIPSDISEILLSIIEEIYLKSAETLSFSLLIIIWSAGKGFFSLSKGIKNIYKIEIKNDFLLRITGSIYTLILVILIIIFLILILLGKSIYITIMKRYYQISLVISIIYRFRIFFLFFIMTTVFYFLYKLITKNKEKQYSHIYGAIFSTIFWQILSYFISLYVNISNNFSYLYGSLSSLILIMLWEYFCIYIILIGAEINFFISKYTKKIN